MNGKGGKRKGKGSAPGEEFRAALASVASTRRLSLARGAISVVLATALALFSILIALNRLLPGWRPLPLLSFVIFWAGIAVSLILGTFWQVFPFRSTRDLARSLGDVTGHGSLFGSALEFSMHGDRLKAYSSFLMDETIRYAGGKLRSIRPDEIYSRRGRPGWMLAGILIGLVVMVQVVLLGTDTGRIMSAVLDPTVYFRTPRGYNLLVTSSDISILAGGDVVAEAVKFGSSRGEVLLRVSSVPGVWKKVPLEPDTLKVGDISHAAYRHTFGAVREDFTYYFEAGQDRTASRSVTVLHRPVINSLKAILEYPAYTRAEPETIETLAGKLVALEGTGVTLEGETSKWMREGWLDFSKAGAVPLSRRPGGFTGAFSVTADDTFVVEVVDSMGLSSERTVRYPVVSLDDRVPIVELLAPEDGALLPRSLFTDLFYRIYDDYGVSSVRLRFMREGKEEGFHTVYIELPPQDQLREIEEHYNWSLEGEGVFPGDRIVYYLEVFDNNPGGGYARTEARRLLVPSISEIYAEIREQEALQRGGMEDVLERGREIKDRLRKLSDDFKAEGKLDWSRRREGQQILDKHRELKEKIGEAADQLDRTLSSIERNRMTSQEVGEKMEEIRNLLRQIESEELRRTIDNFRKMLSEVPEKDMVAAISEMEMNAEELVRRLDRTIELLKQVISEERMEELVRRMEEMIGEQKALRDSTESGNREELSEQQDRLGDEVDRYEEDLSGFKGEQTDSTLASELESILGEMKAAEIDETMRRAAQEIQRGDRDQAQCSQESAINEMLSLYTSLSRCQMSMALAVERELLGRIERAARELVEVSKLQEDFIPELRFGRDPGFRDDLITEQIVLKEALRSITGDLYELVRKTMVISDKVFLHLGMALAQVEGVLDGVEQGKFTGAVGAAGEVCTQLNLAVIELLKVTSSASSGSGGGSRGKMQMMFEGQSAIDRQMRQMLEEGGAEGWSMEQRAMMARLAAEQRKMEELMEQIAREGAGAGGLLGRLDDIAGEMEAVARDLQEGELDEDVLGREGRILSRMLESQRSIHRRDYRRERTSTTAGDVRALDPGQPQEGLDESELLLRMIRRGMQEKGPVEYEELIRMYFRALSRKVREGR